MFLLPQQIKRHVNVLKIEKLNDTDEMYRDAALLLQQKTKSLFFQLTFQTVRVSVARVNQTQFVGMIVLFDEVFQLFQTVSQLLNLL
jgi:hypothetical protein